jgi:hypothetical protein
MHTKKSHGISSHIRETILHSVDKNESKITEAFQTMGHYGIILLAFLCVVGIFLWKEGKLNSPTKSTSNLPTVKPTEALKEIPRADVGMRMIFDQANGELGTDSANLASSSAKPTTSQELSKTFEQTSNLPKLDLQGPWSCTTNTNDGSTKLYIQNGKVKFVSTTGGTTENTLLSGDCLYTWSANAGTKQCGLGQYMDLFATLLPGTEAIDIGSIIEEQMQDDEAQARAYASLRASCQKTQVAESVFAIPQSVGWDESTTETEGVDMLNLFQ